MGQPIKIRDLAVRMIHAAGYTVKDESNPQGDIEIVVTGLRPGEKLHEELLIEPGMLTTPHEKILRARERSLGSVEIASTLRELRNAVATGDSEGALAVLDGVVEDYSVNRRKPMGSMRA
jgi:FlaA1/EpsC-like NDP-sugar epimerase